MMTLAHPTMLDLLTLCSQARPDEIVQYEELTGEEWMIDAVANDFYNRMGVKFVLLDGDRPIAAAGYYMLIDGVWESWMVGTMANWSTHWRSITKYSRKVMEIMFEQNNARRLQTCVMATRLKTCEWYVRGLKMHQECVLRKFGVTGEDMAIYARMR
jgi:hypothetical protein